MARTKKPKEYTAALTMCLIVILLLGGCNTKFNPDYEFAVIETTGEKNETIISYYDSDFDIVNTQNIPYGGMTNPFDLPIIKNGNAYISPEGLGSEKDLHRTIGIDLKTGEEKQYMYSDKQVAITSTAVNSKATYVCSNLDGISRLARSDKSNGKTIDKTLKKRLLWAIQADEDIVYGFVQDEAAETSYLYLYDSDSLGLKTKLSMKKYGSINFSLIYEGHLYFSFSNDKESLLGVYDIKSKKIKWIRFKGQSEISNIVEYNGKLYIGHSDLVQLTGNEITILDIRTGAQAIITFDHTILQFEIKNGRLYALGEKSLYKYKLKNGKATLIGSKDVQTKKEKASAFYYIGSFFVK